MLNRFRIGPKLTAGFVFILLLLALNTGVAYYALKTGQAATDRLVTIQNNNASAMQIRSLLNRAQTQAAKGTLYRDTVYEKARQDVDAQIKEIADGLEVSFTSEDNKQDLAALIQLYQKFVAEDTKFYRAEDELKKLETQRRDGDRIGAEALRNALNAFVKAAEDSKVVDEQNKGVVYVDDRLVEQAAQLRELLLAQMTLRRNYYRMLSETNYEEQQKQSEALLKEGTKLIADTKEFLKSVVDPDRQRMISTAITTFENWIGILSKNVDDHVIQSQTGVEQDRLSGEMTKLLEAITTRAGTRTDEVLKEVASNNAQMLTFMVTSAVIAVILGLGFSMVLTRNIGGGIHVAAAEIKHIAETGDLTVELPPEYLARKDEVGDLAGSIRQVLEEFRAVGKISKELASGDWRSNMNIRGNLDTMNNDLDSMLTQVNNTLHEIDESVKQVATGAGEVSSASQALSNGAQESAASLEEITASMQEISSQTKANAESAGQARDLAQQASKAAAKGQEAMQEMTGAMQQITANSTEIQRVIKVIDDIAFQTNLLALNAAVEAARAGQHGKGFAVVAEEVRNLAARSAKAAKETSELIAKSGNEIERGGEVSTRTAEVLNTIVAQVKQTTDLVAGIATASNEQAQGVNQVSIGLQQIDSVTQQNTASAEECASAANEMSGMATNLQKLVAQFKLRA